MKKFEYQNVFVDLSYPDVWVVEVKPPVNSGFSFVDSTYTEYEKMFRLEELGDNGWEAVGLTMASINDTKHAYVLLKRERREII